MQSVFKLLLLLVVVGLLGIVIKQISQIDTLPQGMSTGSSASELSLPSATDYAVDTSNELSVQDLERLNAKLKTLDTPQHQFGVAVVKSTMPLSIEEYGIRLAEKWKVGRSGLDNGAIIILATHDRKVRIEVGYGLEGEVNDAAAGRIIDEAMIPFLKRNDWYGALNAGLDALAARVN